MLVLLVQAAGLADDDLAAILKRLDAEDYAAREAAQAELDAWCGRAGAKAAEALTAASEGASAEVHARIAMELEYLAKLDEARKVASLFDPLGLRDVSGKTLVIYNAGEPREGGQVRSKYDLGWILAESDLEITLETSRLAVETCARLPKQWERFEDLRPDDKPLLGEYVKLDFDDACRRFLDSPKGKEVNPIAEFDVALVRNGRWGRPSAWYVALLARWALQRGRPHLALDLLVKARKRSEENLSVLAGDRDADLCTRLGEEVVNSLRWGVDEDAAAGRPRAELLARWKVLAAICPEPWVKERVAGYESLLAEDAAWKDLPPEEVAKLDPAGQVKYWMHALRDANAVLPRDREATAIERLVALGWDALPEVIAHLEDGRMSRCMYTGNGIRPEWPTLVSIGWVCGDIFERITAVSSRSKEKAEQWWKENGPAGAEAYYAKVLAERPDGSFRQETAARALLVIDRAKYLPRALELAAMPENSMRVNLYDVVEPYLGKEHEGYLRRLLLDRNAWQAARAAVTLWKLTGIDDGVRQVVKRVEDDDFSHDRYNDGLAALCIFNRARTDFLRETIARWLLTDTMELRAAAISYSTAVCDPRIAAALAELLGHAELMKWKGSSGLGRSCDMAADRLSSMVGAPVRFDPRAPEADRDVRIAELKAWWEAHRASIDWEALRRKAQDAERK